jgi:hypothetical protein
VGLRIRATVQERVELRGRGALTTRPATVMGCGGSKPPALDDELDVSKHGGDDYEDHFGATVSGRWAAPPPSQSNVVTGAAEEEKDDDGE